ncbi:MAG TPA: dynamin family protein [Candidatus Hydrogenedentes bacterium]|nr:dynamin family protein [Candidatus Hydrogenedentota bacterium]HOL77532.1 dynamin family protein [Candidatus Hydrogenedentota bacterium]HPO86589.1 dynamin family protein [Candidatus Hydrogenedentota bacterium]
MSIEKHAENRAWAFQALDELEDFLQDPDFQGDPDEERVQIERKRTELREGKYRVVFIGAFNVGKSTLINALLGDRYLPTVLEECTMKITHILRGEPMRALLRLSALPAEGELEALCTLLTSCGIDADISLDETNRHIAISFPNASAKEMVKTLGTLVTLSAEEDFPHLRGLRAKFEEVLVYVPTENLAEDVCFVDSPGVHSILETHEKIVDEIIPRSHLVVCLIDSQSAGNTQNRDFIQRLVNESRRKVFFVINKSDQLNPEEIDPLGRRGPAKDLFRSLEGVVENPELFFVSALYGLIGTQLLNREIRLEDLDENNKIKIPFRIQRDLLADSDPDRAVAEHLLAQSNLDAFRRRLLSYLYNENRELAIIESVCFFIDARAWKYARPLEVKLDMVREMPRLDELRQLRESLSAQLDYQRKRARQAETLFDTMTRGGEFEGIRYEGYESLVDSYLSETAVDRQILKPLREWLASGDHLRAAKRQAYEPLLVEAGRLLDAFVEDLCESVNRDIQSIENRFLEKITELQTGFPQYGRETIQVSRASLPPVEVSLAASYFGFTLIGILLGACTGGVIAGSPAGWDEQMLLIGAGIGTAAGAIIGTVLRAATSKGVLLERLNAILKKRVENVLLHGTKTDTGQPVASVKAQLKDLLARRREEFAQAIRSTFAGTIRSLEEELQKVMEEEEALRREQQETIERLEPKVQRLSEIGRCAHEIAESRNIAE